MKKFTLFFLVSSTLLASLSAGALCILLQTGDVMRPFFGAQLPSNGLVVIERFAVGLDDEVEIVGADGVAIDFEMLDAPDRYHFLRPSGLAAGGFYEVFVGTRRVSDFEAVSADNEPLGAFEIAAPSYRFDPGQSSFDLWLEEVLGGGGGCSQSVDVSQDRHVLIFESPADLLSDQGSQVVLASIFDAESDERLRTILVQNANLELGLIIPEATQRSFYIELSDAAFNTTRSNVVEFVPEGGCTNLHVRSSTFPLAALLLPLACLIFTRRKRTF